MVRPTAQRKPPQPCASPHRGMRRRSQHPKTSARPSLVRIANLCPAPQCIVEHALRAARLQNLGSERRARRPILANAQFLALIAPATRDGREATSLNGSKPGSPSRAPATCIRPLPAGCRLPLTVWGSTDRRRYSQDGNGG